MRHDPKTHAVTPDPLPWGEGALEGDSLFRGGIGDRMAQGPGGVLGRRLRSCCSPLAHPSPPTGQTRTLRFVFNLTEANRILLRWERYEPLEARDLLSFIVYYKES